MRRARLPRGDAGAEVRAERLFRSAIERRRAMREYVMSHHGCTRGELRRAMAALMTADECDRAFALALDGIPFTRKRQPDGTYETYLWPHGIPQEKAS